MAQINTTVGDLDGNTAKMISWTQSARDAGVDVIVFPEMSITGYPPEDLLFQHSFVSENIDKMRQVVAHSNGITVVFGFVDQEYDLYNAAAVASDGELVGIYHKVYLPNYGVFDEERYFRAGDKCQVYVVNGMHFGVNICEDIWYQNGPTVAQKQSGAQIIFNINASPYYSGKLRIRQDMISKRASDNNLYISYTNLIGGQDELVFDGASMIVSPWGEIMANGKQFEEDLVVVDVDLDAVCDKPIKDPSLDSDGYKAFVISPATVIEHSTHRVDSEKPPITTGVIDAMDTVGEVYSALVLATRDYVSKCGFQKAVIGLSGGIDSTLTAVVAVDALGADNVCGVAMPSRYSSPASLEDAKDLANRLGIEFMTVSIEPAFGSMLDMLSGPFAGVALNVAEENLQTRIRGNILMGLSNKFGWLVLTTGNKSEMATGYATLYGDMAGGFAVIKDVPKTLVYQLCEYRNLNGEPLQVIPDNVIEKLPSAELKHGQLDQDTLPPYYILDQILQAYVEENCSAQDIIDMCFDETVVKKVISMVDRNEYKRRQAPPGVKITQRAFGRDRRLPIVNRYRQS